jgi:erythrocyte band 7 integral membrane protein
MNPSEHSAEQSSVTKAGTSKMPETSTNGGFRVQDNMMAVQPPRQEDLQKSYATVVAHDANPKGWYGSMSMAARALENHSFSRRLILLTVSLSLVNALGAVIGTMGAIPCCIVCPNPYKNVQQGNVGLVTKFGKFYKAVDPGLVKVNPLSERLIQVDVKIQIVGKFFFFFFFF